MFRSRPEVWIYRRYSLSLGCYLSSAISRKRYWKEISDKFDQTILLFFRHSGDVSQPIGPPWFQEMARDVTALGSYVVLVIVIAAVAIYLFMAQQRAAGFWVLATFGGGILLSNLLKFVFERSRPDLAIHVTRVFTTSFPSGHATLSAIAYLTLGALLSGLHASAGFKVYFLTVAVLLTIAIGISRIYLGVHYPTDVLAGWCVGAAWAILSWVLFTRFRTRR